MKKQRLIIWWVDDEASRLKKLAIGRIEAAGKRRTKYADVKVDLHFLKTQQDRVKFEQALIAAGQRDSLPSLVVLDQNLNLAEGLRGSSVAVFVRAEAPAVPVVGVTAADVRRIADLQKDQFVELFSLDELQSGDRISDLFAIADGFSSVYGNSGKAASPEKQLKQILKWLDCPEGDSALLGACVPGDFLAVWDEETPHSFARWVWHVLTGRLGFLCDDLELATLLGLQESGLQAVRANLKGAVYEGVFASDSRRRWWVSRASSAVRKATKSDVLTPLWKLGRQLATETQVRGFSRCFGQTDRKCVPDVVAYSDDTHRERVQTRSEDTEPVETDTPPPGFEQYRVFCGG